MSNAVRCVRCRKSGTAKSISGTVRGVEVVCVCEEGGEVRLEAGERGQAGEGRGEGGGVLDGGEVDVGYAGAGGDQEVALCEGAGEVDAAVEEEVADVLVEEGGGMARDGGGQRGGGEKRVPARRDRVSARVLSEGAFFVAYDDNAVEQRLEPAMRN